MVSCRPLVLLVLEQDVRRDDKILTKVVRTLYFASRIYIARACRKARYFSSRMTTYRKLIIYKTDSLHTRLFQVALLSGKDTFPTEQKHLFSPQGRCLAHIAVTTPGRLVNHLRDTPLFNLQHLR